MTDDETKATEDLKRLARETVKAGIPATVRTFDEVGGYDEVNGDGDGALVNLIIGQRGKLTRAEARNAATAYRKIIVQYPKAVICAAIAGFDTDRREIWEISEAREYLCYWAKYLGLDHSDAVLAAPFIDEMFGVLAKCGALKDVDPATVPVPVKH